MKFHAFHVRFSGGTGRRSSFYEHKCQQPSTTRKGRTTHAQEQLLVCEIFIVRNLEFAQQCLCRAGERHDRRERVAEDDWRRSPV